MIFIEIPTEEIVEQTRKIREMMLDVDVEVVKLRRMCNAVIKTQKTDTTATKGSGV